MRSTPPGRKPMEETLNNAQAAEVCLPEGFTPAECYYVRDSVVWRIIDGNVVRVAYET